MKESSAHSQRVLIADDDDDILELVNGYVTRKNFEVTAVKDGIDALIAVLHSVKDNRQYDAVILDCAMPFADGFSVVKAIRCLEANHVLKARTPIGLYTGYTELLAPSTLLEKSDIDGFVAKPGHEELLLMIAQLVNLRPEDNGISH
jgi:CheY-like chemotaxis protein